jgi:chromate reductase
MAEGRVILGLAGSLRTGASSVAVLRSLLDRLPPGWQGCEGDIGALAHYSADHDGGAPVARLLAQIAAARGLLIVTPEYNYSIPGVLKNALDWASRPAYRSVLRGKPCLVASVSAGAMGGVRAQGHLKTVLGATLAQVFPWPEIAVPEAPKKLHAGRLADPATLAFADEALAAWCATLG